MSRRKSDRSRVRILVLLSGGILIAAMVLAVVIPLITGIGSSNDIIDAEGVFIKEGGKWRRIDLDNNPWIPSDNRTYLIYFKNINSRECKEFDTAWLDYLRKYAAEDNVTPVQIVCSWFAQQCADETASACFLAYRVPFTPAILVVSQQKILYYGPPPSNSTGLHNLIEEALKKLNTTMLNTTSK